MPTITKLFSTGVLQSSVELDEVTYDSIKVSPTGVYADLFDEFTGAPVVDSSLKLWLDAGQTASYSGTGSTWTDLSGNSLTGTLTNGPTYSSANGGSIVFDGTNDFIQCSGSLTVTAATFVIWIRRNGSQDSYDGILFSRGTNTTGVNFYSSNQLGYHWNDTFSTYAWASGLTIPDLTWCMIAVSVTSTAATAYLCQTSGITTATNTVSHASSVLDDIRLAHDEVGGASRFFNGSIASAMIYNRALSAAEIAQNYNSLCQRYGLSPVTSTQMPVVKRETSTGTILVNGSFDEYTPMLSAGLFKTTYAGYFADVVSFFATATPATYGTNPSTSVQTTSISEAASDDGSNFSCQWLGYFLPSTTETYTFFTSSDDASYVWIGSNAISGFTTGNAVVNNGGAHAVQERNGTISLTAGTYYPIRIQFGEAGGGDAMTFSYSTPTITKTTNVTSRVFYDSNTSAF